LSPAAHAGQFIGASAPKERGKHEAEECAEQLLLGSQAAFNLDDEGIGYAQVIEGLMEGADIALGLSLPAVVFWRIFGAGSWWIPSSRL
jgi:hypothetical protein